MAKFIAYMSLGWVDDRREEEFEVPDDELEDLSESERDRLIEDYAKDVVSNHLDWGWRSADA